MSSSKIGSAFSPSLVATVRPTVERPVARPEPRAVGHSSRDEFVPKSNSRSSSLLGTEAPPSTRSLTATEQSTSTRSLTATEEPSDVCLLPETLEPFRKDLDDLALKISTEQPDLLNDESKLMECLTESMRQLGIDEKDFAAGTTYLLAKLYNGGKDRLQ
ncbi:MAG TPA: hypothetical protein VF815_07400 [Myxococcaceae bacterium]|jgi:hypothetical protein